MDQNFHSSFETFPEETMWYLIELALQLYLKRSLRYKRRYSYSALSNALNSLGNQRRSAENYDCKFKIQLLFGYLQR